jgi:transcriptional regulator with XRE-family HTH domain
MVSMTMLVPKTGVAANVRAELARHMVSQAAIADKLHLGHSAMSRRLRGETQFRADELKRIAEHLGIGVEVFYESEAAS